MQGEDKRRGESPMKIFAVVASGILALGLAAGGTSAKDAAGQTNFQVIVATMNNVEWTISEIGQVRNVSDVTLVQLDDSTGANEQAFIRALAVQQGTAQVDALRAAVVRNERLVGELKRGNVEYMKMLPI